MLIDSHCHLNFPELYNNIDDYLKLMQENNVAYALCVATRPDNIEKVIDIATQYENLFASTGIHPDEPFDNFNLTEEFLLKYTFNPKVIAIGETGLDYYHATSDTDIESQKKRFITHIEVAKKANLPLIIHTRDAIVDTLDIMKSYNASQCLGVMHCFTESKDWMQKCLDLGFYISISGIVTFKNAQTVQEMARYVPLDRLLIETDSPFLAPNPFRGKTNHPALVKYVAEFLADLKNIKLEQLAEATSRNFCNLFARANLKI